MIDLSSRHYRTLAEEMGVKWENGEPPNPLWIVQPVATSSNSHSILEPTLEATLNARALRDAQAKEILVLAKTALEICRTRLRVTPQ